MNPVDYIGWTSSLVLIVTLGRQVTKQWQSQQASGVSRWLFAGQVTASVGFSLYSYLLNNWVFLATNLLLLLNALAGQWVTWRILQRQRSGPDSERSRA